MPALVCHLTGHERREVHLGPVTFDSFSVRSPDTGLVIECITNVALGAMSGKMEFRDEEDDEAVDDIDLKIQREVLHPRRKMDGELASDIVRDNVSPPVLA